MNKLRKPALVLLLALAIQASAADQRNFWLLNNTGEVIYRVRISPHGSTAPWSDDILGSGTLAPSNGAVVFFHDNNLQCTYDFRIEYRNGRKQDYTDGRNLCLLHAIQFNESTNDAF